jgi:hypothetical protein
MSVLGSEQEPFGYVIWHLAERIPPDQEEFRKQLPTLITEVLDRKVETLINEYLRDEWNKLQGKIRIDEAFQQR